MKTSVSSITQCIATIMLGAASLKNIRHKGLGSETSLLLGLVAFLGGILTTSFIFLRPEKCTFRATESLPSTPKKQRKRLTYDEMPELQLSPARNNSVDEDDRGVELSLRDVLCTSSGEVLQDTKNLGNQTYWRLVEYNQTIYWKLSSEKRPFVSQSIAQTMMGSGSRFLIRDASGEFEEMTFTQAVEKTSEALRLGRLKTTRSTALRPAVGGTGTSIDTALRSIPLPVF